MPSEKATILIFQMWAFDTKKGKWEIISKDASTFASLEKLFDQKYYRQDGYMVVSLLPLGDKPEGDPRDGSWNGGELKKFKF